MMLLLKPSRGAKLVLRPQDQPRYYPPATTDAVAAEVYWRVINPVDLSRGSWQLLGVFPPGIPYSVPYDPEVDSNVEVSSISISATGVRSVSTPDDGVRATLIHQRETDAPVIGQTGPARADLVPIGISGFTRYARYRRISIADNPEMASALVILLDSAEYAARELPKYYDLQRELGGSPAVAATAQIEMTGYNDGDQITVGDETFTFVDGDGTANNIDIGSGETPTIAAQLAAKITAATATTYCTAAHSTFSALIALTASIPGDEGNDIVLASLSDDFVLTPFAGGSDGATVLPQTNYLTVAHSSGTTWTPESEVLAVTFADGAGEGGTEGDFDPFPRDYTFL